MTDDFVIDKLKNDIHRKFNMLTIIDVDVGKTLESINRANLGELKRYESYFICRCDCGNITVVGNNELKYNGTKSCGCLSIKKLNQRNSIVKGISLYDWLTAENALDMWSVNNNKDPKNISFKSNKKFLFTCRNGHGDFERNCCDFIKNQGCPVCSNQKIVKGINDVATTHPSIVKYFVNIEDAYKYSCGSGKSVSTRCPVCGQVQLKRVTSFSDGNFKCEICSDKASYPEKFMAYFLNIIGQKYIIQLSKKDFKWCDKYKYDFYITKHNCIIECHGGQHYSCGFDTLGGRTLEEEQENDKLKRELALGNGVNHYIELDCRYSNMEWIKQSIMDSELPKLFGFKEEDIDWSSCHKSTMKKSMMIKACKLWNSGLCSPSEIGKVIGFDRATVRKYLKNGSILGLCDYTVNLSREEAGKRTNRTTKKRVGVFKGGLCVYEFESCNDAGRRSEEILGIYINRQLISEVCRKKKVLSSVDFTLEYLLPKEE